MNVQELEARFREIDEAAESEPVKVSVEGDSESDASLNVTVSRKAATGLNREGFESSADRGAAVSETLLDVSVGGVDIPEEYIDRKLREIFTNTGKVGVLEQPDVKQVGATRDWELRADYPYAVGGHTVTVLKGFRYDRSSIPPLFWPLVDKDSLSSVAPLFHDLFYRYGGALPADRVPPRDGTVTPYRTFERKEVDDLFLELMVRSDVKPWRANVAYQAVRKFARLAWKG